jgi:hypothetical protein
MAGGGRADADEAVAVVVSGGRARDAVEESMGVAMEEESAGEDGVAAVAAPSPNLARGGRAASFSFAAAAATCCCCCCCLGRGVLAGPGGVAGVGSASASASTMDVSGLTGIGAE